MQPGGRNQDTSNYTASALSGRHATRAAQTAAATEDWENGMFDDEPYDWGDQPADDDGEVDEMDGWPDPADPDTSDYYGE